MARYGLHIVCLFFVHLFGQNQETAFQSESSANVPPRNPIRNVKLEMGKLLIFDRP